MKQINFMIWTRKKTEALFFFANLAPNYNDLWWKIDRRWLSLTAHASKPAERHFEADDAKVHSIYSMSSG